MRLLRLSRLPLGSDAVGGPLRRRVEVFGATAQQLRGEVEQQNNGRLGVGEGEVEVDEMGEEDDMIENE